MTTTGMFCQSGRARNSSRNSNPSIFGIIRSRMITSGRAAVIASTRTLHDGVEYRLGIIERVADDAENFGGRCLLLQRFGKLASARLHIVEQPRVLDRDHRLVSKRRHQLDLLVSKTLHALARENDHADRHILPQERHAQRSSSLSEAGRFR